MTAADPTLDPLLIGLGRGLERRLGHGVEDVLSRSGESMVSRIGEGGGGVDQCHRRHPLRHGHRELHDRHAAHRPAEQVC